MHTDTSPERPAVPSLTLGWRLKMALDHGDITANQMADELGYSRSQLSRFLNDKGVPRRTVLRQWALRCGVPFDWLAYGIIDLDPRDPAEQASRTSPWKSDRRVVRPLLLKAVA